MKDEGRCSWGDRKDKADSVQGIVPREIGNEPHWLRALSFHMLWDKRQSLGLTLQKEESVLTVSVAQPPTRFISWCLVSPPSLPRSCLSETRFLLAAPALTLNLLFLASVGFIFLHLSWNSHLLSSMTAHSWLFLFSVFSVSMLSVLLINVGANSLFFPINTSPCQQHLPSQWSLSLHRGVWNLHGKQSFLSCRLMFSINISSLLEPQTCLELNLSFLYIHYACALCLLHACSTLAYCRHLINARFLHSLSPMKWASFLDFLSTSVCHSPLGHFLLFWFYLYLSINCQHLPIFPLQYSLWPIHSLPSTECHAGSSYYCSHLTAI